MWEADVYNCLTPPKTSGTWVTSSGQSSNVSQRHLQRRAHPSDSNFLPIRQ